jgi:hypothetical protein
MALAFRYADATEYPRISKFLNQYWAHDHVYTRDRSLFDWTFGPRPQWPHQGYSFALAEDDRQELAGILGGIPFWFNCFGKRTNGIWIANYVVRPDERRGSAALQLLSMFRRPCFQPVIAFGINPATATIYRVLHGEVLPLIPRWLAFLPEGLARAVNLLQLVYPEWEEGRARQLAEAFCLARLPVNSAAAEHGIPETWDALEWPAIAERTVGAARDAAYLRWRYCEHPRFPYRLLAVRDAGRWGLLAWRLETIRRATPQGREDVDRIGRLLEFLPASRTNAMELLAEFFRELSAAGALGADYYGYHGETNCLLAAAGFGNVEKHPDGGLIPCRFQPLDGKGGEIMSAMFRHEAPPCTIDPKCPWYWTKSDSDQDRPN